MKELVNKLNEARKAYYFGEQSPLSDREYDALYDRLVSMEVETGIILPGSPTQEVGYTVVSELSKVKHEQKASTSFRNGYSFLRCWLQYVFAFVLDKCFSPVSWRSLCTVSIWLYTKRQQPNVFWHWIFCFSFGYIAYTKALFAITLPPLTIILFKDTYSSANPYLLR